MQALRTSTPQSQVALRLCRCPVLIPQHTLTSGGPSLLQYLPPDLPLPSSSASPDPGSDRPETCRAGPNIYGGNGELLSPRLVALGSGMGLGMEGELVSPLLMAPVHIDPSCLHPDLLTEVQHVVIAREQLLLHLNQVIGRGQFPLQSKRSFHLSAFTSSNSHSCKRSSFSYNSINE